LSGTSPCPAPGVATYSWATVEPGVLPVLVTLKCTFTVPLADAACGAVTLEYLKVV
jgi:hypothetical protein